MAYTSSRPGAIVESSCYAGSNEGLTYRDFKLTLFPNPWPGEGDLITLEVTLRHLKEKRSIVRMETVSLGYPGSTAHRGNSIGCRHITNNDITVQHVKRSIPAAGDAGRVQKGTYNVYYTPWCRKCSKCPQNPNPVHPPVRVTSPLKKCQARVCQYASSAQLSSSSPISSALIPTAPISSAPTINTMEPSNLLLSPLLPRRTPSPRPPPIGLNDTPFTHSHDDRTSHSRGTENCDSTARKVQDHIVAADFFGTAFCEVDNFVDTIYPPLDDSVVNTILAAFYNTATGRWMHWPTHESEANVYSWFQRLEVEIRSASNRLSSRIVRTGNNTPSDSISDRRPDLIFVEESLSHPCKKPGSCCQDGISTANCPRPRVSWMRTRAFGELKKNSRDIGKNQATHNIIISLMDRAREMFRCQPTRRRIHCFTLGGDLLRCFVIDRAGIVESKAFSIHKEHRNALRVFSAFFTGNISWYGLDPTVLAEINGREVIFDCTDPSLDSVDPFLKVPSRDEAGQPGAPIRIYVDFAEPIFSRESVVCRGTALWKAKREGEKEWEYVVKSAWRNSERPHEGSFLEKLEHSGLCKYFHHEDVHEGGFADTENGTRRGLDLSNATQILPDNPVPLSSGNYGTMSSSSALNPSAERGIVAYETYRPNKRQGTVIETPTKRLKSDNKVDANSMKTPKPYSRTHGRLIMQSHGRPLHTFTTATELLLALRAALDAHLYLRSKDILHRDISTNNILLPSGDRSPGHASDEGFLIDFDYAISLQRGSLSGAPHRTGTPIFMAIGVLDNEPSCFHYDLHSFFYVLLWTMSNWDMPASNTVSGQAHEKIISSWARGSYQQLYGMKIALLDSKTWGRYRAQALDQPGWQKLKKAMDPLLQEWFQICFPIHEKEEVLEGIFTKTVHKMVGRAWKAEDLGSIELMYDKMIRALDITITELDGK
ncbi:hypothetical protein EX30DRAFT_386680 [Ascodesmis nigricans]|uniref:EKC/KEOPS complex subunit BUD32 n=1 Tax=Ascodesmis nigricans TaxID=341454 RepID=A0A4S2N0H2_9PEZI|nr:hypothetical protein EX30DRAFT_386680 [Ascodesmis nigricans]